MAKWTYLLAVPLALAPVLDPFPLLAQTAPPAAPADQAPPAYSQEDLLQMLAPIALYPDDLLMQVLIASTYPLEVVLAARWLDQGSNKTLKGDALAKALESQDWDPSVKSLVPFPDVLKTMSDHLDWTQRVGDAFLAQQADVFAAIQALRAKAQAAGTLTSNAQQTVSQQDNAIVIQPAQTNTVFVPVYNPSVAFGTWPYPASPPVYWPPPPGYAFGSALLTGLAFGAGVAVVGSLWGWASPGWGGGNVNINANRFNNINVNRVNANRNNVIAGNTWQHNPDHRRGVAYSNNQTQQRFRPTPGGDPGARQPFRGREGGAPGAGGPGGGPGGGLGGGLGGGQGQRPNLPNGGNSGQNRPGGGPGGGGGPGAGGGIGGGGGIQRPNPPGGGNPGQNLPGGGGNLGQNRPGGPGGSPGGGPGGGPGGDVQRPSPPGGGNLAQNRPGGAGGGAGGGAARPMPQRPPQAAQRPAGPPAFQGVGNGGATRAESAQGRASRASPPPRAAAPRGGGGGAPRGGGGGGGGGGGQPRRGR